jgi:uncharacterized protein
MPEFVNPFSGVVNKKINERELTRALRLALASEQEAVHLYESIADATDNPLAKQVLQDIADEERVHVGEFQELLSNLVEDEDQLLDEGANEVAETIDDLGLDQIVANVIGESIIKKADKIITKYDKDNKRFEMRYKSYRESDPDTVGYGRTTKESIENLKEKE